MNRPRFVKLTIQESHPGLPGEENVWYRDSEGDMCLTVVPDCFVDRMDDTVWVVDMGNGKVWIPGFWELAEIDAEDIVEEEE